MLYNLFENRDFVSVFAVALLAEGVDRNPKTDALVTAPGCGHLMYGAITQINYGDTKHTTIASRRVPKFSLNQENDLRKTILKARPLAAPHNYCPWIRVKNVVG